MKIVMERLNKVKVVLYKTTNCSRCAGLKKRLETLKIDYEERNIEKDSNAMADMLMLGQWTMPVLTRDGKLVDIEELKKEITLADFKTMSSNKPITY